MRLFEAILEANHRALAGDASAGLRPAEHAESLPVAALTCMDPRLGPLLPEVLGIPEEQFIWLRNAGNVVTGPLSSTLRSLALACAVKGAREIAVIGHTDCRMARTPALQLLEAFKDLGVERHLLPENLNEYFHLFASERQNVLRACEIIRHSPLIGPRVPVHGLVVDIETGRLEWLVNGYEAWQTMADRFNQVVKTAGQTVDALRSLADFQIGEMKFPETRIGETVTQAADWLSQKIGALEIQPPAPGQPASGRPGVGTVLQAAEHLAELARKHAAKSGAAPAQAPPPAPPAPPPGFRIPLPPRIAPRPQLKRK